MNPGITITVQDAITPKLAGLFAGLGDDRRSELHESMGAPVAELTRQHLDGLAATRHDTANRLGVTPSGFFAQAAEKVSLAADAKGATISIDQPGMGRAAHDVDIVPGPGKKALAIPLIAAAYNQRAYAVSGLFVVHLVGGGDPLLAMEAPDGGLVFWYRLVPKVHQQQDRTMLPSNQEIGEAARLGAREYMGHLFNTAAQEGVS